MNERFDTAAALAAFIAALIGGAVSYLRNTRAYSLARAIAALFMSGLAGLACWLACTFFSLPGPLAAVCTGLAGHMGAELTRVIETRG